MSHTCCCNILRCCLGSFYPLQEPSDHPTAVTLQLLLLGNRHSRDEVYYLLWDPVIIHLQKFGYMISSFLL